jgi:CRP-like cAMP-binding protein
MAGTTPTITAFRFAQGAEPFAAGDVLFRQGEPGDVMFVVREGEVEISVGGEVVETIGPGGLMGEMALIDAGPRSATATARTGGSLVRVDMKRFEFLVQQHPFFAIEVMRIMAHRLRQMDARLAAQR